LLARDTTLRIESFHHDEWGRALDGADAVLVQIREGGLEARLYDETFPKRYGIPGDEGLGPGGLSAAIRSWPVLRRILSLVNERAPLSLKLLLTSPAGLLVRAAAHEFPGMDLCAICELPFTTLQSITSSPVTFGYTGVNHLGWLHNIIRGGEPVVEDPVPLKYWRMHFDRENALREAPRAPTLMRIRDQAYRAFNLGAVAEIRAALALRPAPWYTHAVGPLLADVTTQPYFLTRPELEGEHPYSWTGGTFEPLASPAAPHFARRLVDKFLEYERQALPAVLHPSSKTVQQALNSHPWSQRQAAGFQTAAGLQHVVEQSCLR
jgi:6-phospho-beta-glucosidase